MGVLAAESSELFETGPQSDRFGTRAPGPPLGFPLCPICPLVDDAAPTTCIRCLASSTPRRGLRLCPVCSQVLGPGSDPCRNRLCGDPHRSISRIRALSTCGGGLRRQIIRHKEGAGWDWSQIFGRLLVGWLADECAGDRPDLILANPTSRGRAGARPGHTEQVIRAAASEDREGRWTFDLACPPAIVKTAETSRSTATSALSKLRSAEEIGAALRIPDPRRVHGRRIFVYDDVCTTGYQLDAVARVLIDQGGAGSVEGVVLARAPWRTTDNSLTPSAARSHSSSATRPIA